MKRVIVELLIMSIWATNHVFAQGTFSNVSSVNISSTQINRIKEMLRGCNLNDNIYNIVVSRCIIDSFHEFGDYGPYIDGKTIQISQPGVRIEYHRDDTTTTFCNFHKKEDSCRGMKTTVTLFIPDNLNNCYRSYICRFGFPPSFGGAAKINKIEEWHKKLIGIIKNGR